MRKRAAIVAAVITVCGMSAVALHITAPSALPSHALDDLTPDPNRGARIFAVAGCASCHTAPEAEASDTPVLSGGRQFATQFGTFIAPNISPDPDAGVGAWSDFEIVQAITRGVSPEGQHYYPAFPYSSYARSDLADIYDLTAFLRTLPASSVPSQPHDVSFPFNIRRMLGGWKFLFMDSSWVIDADLSPEATRGRMLVEGLGHCGECHTPRNFLGGLETSNWLGGAANPSGDGRIPNITPGDLTWSAGEIEYYLETGFTPSFDTAGGEMVSVISNLAKLPAEDRQAIAAYLKSVPPITP